MNMDGGLVLCVPKPCGRARWEVCTVMTMYRRFSFILSRAQSGVDHDGIVPDLWT